MSGAGKQTVNFDGSRGAQADDGILTLDGAAVTREFYVPFA